MSERDGSPEPTKPQPTVWVVMRNEDYEGGCILHVLTSREKAVDWVEKYISDQPVAGHVWMKHEGGWKLGCNSIDIEPWDVK